MMKFGVHLLVISSLAVLSANFVLSESSTEFCVIPTKHTPCPCSVVCHTFDHYLSKPETYFQSHVTFLFLHGVHEVKKSFLGRNLTGLHLTAGANATVTVDITSTDSNSSWFTLYHSSNVIFDGLDFLVRERASFSVCKLYILELNDVSDVKVSRVSLNNSCGGGVYLADIQTRKIQFDKAAFEVYGHGINMINVNCVVDVSHSVFFGRQNFTLLYAYYTMLTSNSALSIQHSEFYNGSGSVYIDISMAEYSPASFALNMKHVTCKTPNGSDISVMVISTKGSSEDLYVNATFDNVFLPSAMKSAFFLEFGTYFGKYTITINECRIHSHNECAIRMSLGNNPESQVFITNSVVKGNQAVPTVFPISGMLIKGSSINPILNPYTILRGVTFESNSYITSASIDIVVTVLLYFIDNIEMIDCTFKSNIGTALYLENSSFTASGNLTFTNNTAYEGAAIFVNGPSIITASKETRFVFANNTANHAGGAIYITTDSGDTTLFTLPFPVKETCFINVEGGPYQCAGSDCILQFESNMANDGGDAIYGGDLDMVRYNGGSKMCIAALHEVSSFTFSRTNITSMSAISSAPSRVCLCKDNTALCLKYKKTIAIHPGQIFNISAFAVGQDFGSSRGTVFAQILNKSRGASISSNDRVQAVGQYYCNDSYNLLSYKVMTPLSVGSEILVLTAKDVTVSNLVNENAVNISIEQYIKDNSSVPQELLALPVYLTLNFLPCPVGFKHSASSGTCVCTPLFTKHSGRYSVTCDINSGTVQRQYSVWVDASNTTARYSQHCPFLYCKSAVVPINLSAQNGVDRQCLNHRSGVLCGRCKNGYSLAIGSSRCLHHCSNEYLSLFLLFAAAGVLLVLFIKYLNLTTTQGMINGFIFYANIVQTNKNVFLASNELAVRVFAAFIAWFNLDIGIEMCFYHDLDAYTKTWLQFAFPLYLWALAGGIILVCRYSPVATRFFGNNAVHVLATIFLLSYNKLLRIITTVLSSASVAVQDLHSEDTWNDNVWTSDGNIHYFDSRHVVLFVVCAGVFLFLWLPFTLCILLGQWLQRYNHYRGLQWLGRIRPLLEAYYGPLKDCRHYWVGIVLLARVVVIIPAANPLASTSANVLTVIILCIVLLLITACFGGFYKKYYLTVMESALLAILASSAALWLYFDDTNGTQDIAVYIMVGLFSLGFLLALGIQSYEFLLKCLRKRGYLPERPAYADLDIQRPFEEVAEER